MGKVVLLTGASTGIGLASTHQLAEAGYKVYATCRNPEKAERLQELAKKVSNITILPMDVGSEESIQKAVSIVMEKEETLDVVINNAGFGIYGPVEMHTIQEMQQIFEVNVLGSMRVLHAVAPIMRKQLSGRIINIGSIAGAIPSKNMPLYAAAKAALESLTATMAYHLSLWNIMVLLIQPGPVVTNFEPKTVYGTRFKPEENPYDATTLSKDRELWKIMMESGQDPIEVAKVIQKAIELSNPNLWLQTSVEVAEKIGKHFKDLTGNNRVPQPSHTHEVKKIEVE